MSYTGTGSVMAFPISLYEHIDLFHCFTNQLRREHLFYQLPYTTPTKPWPCQCCTHQYESLQIRISLDFARRSHRYIVRFPTSYFLAFRDQGRLHAHSDIDRDRYSSSSSAKRPRGKASAPSLLAREASDYPLSLLFADSGFDRRRVDRLVQSERLCWARDLDPPTRASCQRPTAAARTAACCSSFGPSRHLPSHGYSARFRADRSSGTFSLNDTLWD